MRERELRREWRGDSQSRNPATRFSDLSPRSTQYIISYYYNIIFFVFAVAKHGRVKKSTIYVYYDNNLVVIVQCYLYICICRSRYIAGRVGYLANGGGGKRLDVSLIYLFIFNTRKIITTSLNALY